MVGRIEPTPLQLLHAWQLLRRQRRRAPWPADFEATMADPLLAALVRMQAVLRVMAAQRQRLQPAATLSVPASAPPTHARRAPTMSFDPKKAAANDRDD